MNGIKRDLRFIGFRRFGDLLEIWKIGDVSWHKFYLIYNFLTQFSGNKNWEVVMAHKVREFEAPGGIRGFVQEEGVIFSSWVVYENSGWFGAKKIGSVEPKEDELRKFLEQKYGKPVKIWWLLFFCAVTFFLLKNSGNKFCFNYHQGKFKWFN